MSESTKNMASKLCACVRNTVPEDHITHYTKDETTVYCEMHTKDRLTSRIRFSVAYEFFFVADTQSVSKLEVVVAADMSADNHDTLIAIRAYNVFGAIHKKFDSTELDDALCAIEAFLKTNQSHDD